VGHAGAAGGGGARAGGTTRAPWTRGVLGGGGC
jgi:hypothetical protein